MENFVDLSTAAFIVIRVDGLQIPTNPLQRGLSLANETDTRLPTITVS